MQFPAVQLLLSEQLKHAVGVLLVKHGSLDQQFGSQNILSLVDIGKVQMNRLELFLVFIPGLVLFVEQQRHLLSVCLDIEGCLDVQFASLAF